jgi:hypothetical protein
MLLDVDDMMANNPSQTGNGERTFSSLTEGITILRVLPFFGDGTSI